MTKKQIEDALHDLGWTKDMLAQKAEIGNNILTGCIKDGRLTDSQLGHRRRIEAILEEAKLKVKQAALGVVLDALSERDMGGKVELLLPSETGITVKVDGAVVGHYYPEAMAMRWI